MSKPLNVALIGAGGIFRAHAPAYKQFPDRLRLTAVCDVRRESAERWASDMAVDPRHVYTDIITLLRESEVEAVDICSTHASHAELAIAALRAGKHVLVEKPMACSMQECRAMVAAADEAGRTLMVAQTQRYDPSYRGVKRLIDSFELGPIRACRMDSMQNGPDAIGHHHWLMDGQVAGGGTIISVAVHKLDLMRFLLGDVARVTAATRMAHPAFKNGAEDYAIAILEFVNGAVGEVFSTYSGFRQPYSEMFMIFGDDGVIHALPEQGQYGGPALVASRRRTPQLKDFMDSFRGFEPVTPATEGLQTDSGFINELLHFAECCATGHEPISSGRDNLGTMKVVLGIYESARRKAPVELAEL